MEEVIVNVLSILMLLVALVTLKVVVNRAAIAYAAVRRARSGRGAASPGLHLSESQQTSGQ